METLYCTAYNDKGCVNGFPGITHQPPRILPLSYGNLLAMPGRILIPAAGLLCFAPFMSSPVALLLGCLIAVVFGNPYQNRIRKLTPNLLAGSIVGLGAGMDLHVVLTSGISGLAYTALSITAILSLGYAIGRFLKVSRNISILVSVGTAICGGSAIAAVAPVIRAKPHDTSVALAVVFLLNAIALVVFPPIGHYFDLTQDQFGLWSALAIHDTSSVVGATMQYGEAALEKGTTIKLVRALWIVPVALLIGLLNKAEHTENVSVKAKKPWFILGFVAMAALVTWVPALQQPGTIISTMARQLLVVTLFLIGTSLTRESLREVGIKPCLQGIALWFITTITTLIFIVFLQGFLF